MPKSYVYKSYDISGNPGFVRDAVVRELLSRDFGEKRAEGIGTSLRYSSLFFSSKNPLTCISRLTIAPDDTVGNRIIVGASFARIRYFTIAVMILLCVALPAFLGYVQHGMPDIPPMAFLGIPLGFLLHYHVRARAFRALGRLISSCDDVSKTGGRPS
ncbi:MAG: hypothetical protein J7M24_00845 [Candidatus Latescibacteria bacterium]|nr:hypothetical protein [Candidatus Latescibacterota bacterium]